MVKLLIILMALSARTPSFDSLRTIGWKPRFTEPADVQVQQATLGLLTHCSLKFDPLRATAPAVQSAVAALKAGGHPVLYLHDKYNPTNPAWTYLYDDWKPTAYVGSDIGHIDINLTHVRHVVCLGGFYEQCERSTVTDLVRLWRRDAPEEDFRLTQVTDGVFTVLSYLRSGDWYERRVRKVHRDEFTSKNRKAVITLKRTLDEIPQEELHVEFLLRQVVPLPGRVNVVFDVNGVVYPYRRVGSEAPTLTLAYRSSDRFLEFQEPSVDFNPAQMATGPGYYPSGRIYPRRVNQTYRRIGTPSRGVPARPAIRRSVSPFPSTSRVVPFPRNFIPPVSSPPGETIYSAPR